ncbi:myosin-11-like [Mizuhopecten yessoensis]|uniref:Laminin subunit alpha-3 n=1 Tax=Mizuhopecten yessoensis TaxID=6573 RepID=A0A210QCH1_MIZYE|nr:myosin-11-like [Mizuhopecten yessoensis]XP_021361710.1 myosin-11-like [Mizuhopecten yessoensis]XP_021361711.1 myosin-11-like [Mizuhopecten yessoensis]OWF46411.1 Laminin subunit alpha-3 [Mizuhopecten yessoensis]
MGTFFSSEHLKNVTKSLQIVQENIVSQRTLGDAAWLQVKNIHDRLDDIKISLYNKVCSRCKSKVKKILGETPSRKRNLINDLPPERQMLLRDLACSMIEMEISKSRNKDVSDADISLTLDYFDDNRYAKKVEEQKATIEEYKKLLRDAEENAKTAEIERDEIAVSLIEKELNENEERNRLKLMEAEKDEQQTKIEERTREGSKLANENTCLVNKIVFLQTQLDAQKKALDRLIETTVSPSASDVEKNRHVHATTSETGKRGREDKEVLQLRQENETLSTIIAELQRNQGKEIEELKPVREETNIGIPNLEEEEDLIEKENAKYVKKMTNSAEDERVFQNQFEKSETQTKRFETSQAYFDPEMQNSMKKQVTELQDENARYSEEISNSAEEITNLKRKLTTLENENETLNKKFTTMAKTKNDLELTAKTLTMEKLGMEDSVNEQMRQIQDENTNYASEIQNATEEINRLNTEMTEKITSLSKTNHDLEMTSTEQAKERQEMEDSLNEQMRQLQNETTSYTNQIQNATEEINKLKTEVTTSAYQIETLNEKLTSLSQTKKELEMLSKVLEKEKQEMEDSFNEQLRQLQDENTSYVKECSDSAEEIKQLKKTATTLSQSKNELEKIAKTIEKENEELTKQVTDLREMKENLSSNVSVLQQDNVRLRSDLSATQEEMKSARKEIEQNQEQNQQLGKEIVQHVIEIESSTRAIDTLKTDIAKSDLQISSLEKDIATVTQSKDRLETLAQTLQREKQDIRKILTEQMTPLPDEKDDILSIISGFQCYIDRLQIDLRTKTDELDSAVSELKEIKSKKKSVVMGLRIERSGMGKTMVDMVSKELTKRLHGILEREGIDITIKLCQTPSEVPNGPLVVLCLNMSRVGTNILSALEGITISQDVFVLVLHNTLKDNLSLLTPTGLRISESKLRQLGGIMDMAFSSDSGVYECDFNSSNVDKMATTLRKYTR